MLGIIFGPLVDNWTSIYTNHAMLRTIVGFVHVGGLMLGGGCAIAADLATIEAVREGVMLAGERGVKRADVRAWRRLHTVAVSSLVLWFLTTLAGAALPNV